MDKITYKKKGDKFTKTIIQEEVINVTEEMQALETQIADLKSGIADTSEDQAKIDELIENYEEALIVLKS